jgi:lysophospholipase L1-like esterase
MNLRGQRGYQSKDTMNSDLQRRDSTARDPGPSPDASQPRGRRGLGNHLPRLPLGGFSWLPGILWAFALAATALGEPLLKKGQAVAFLGDSITLYGAQPPGGFIRLVESGAAANGVDIRVIPSGVSGNKSDQMLQRLERDVLAKKPDWMVLSCGLNDVWHGEKGVPLEAFQRNVTEILDHCAQSGVRVLVMTATQISLPLDNLNNQKLAPYNLFLRNLARERQLPLADVNAAMAAEQEALRTAGLPRSLTTDGVHMNHHGQVMLAAGILRGFGFEEAQITLALKRWRSLPDAVPVTANVKFSLPDMEALEALAAARKQSVESLIGEQVRNALRTLLSDRTPPHALPPPQNPAPPTPVPAPIPPPPARSP